MPGLGPGISRLSLGLGSGVARLYKLWVVSEGQEAMFLRALFSVPHPLHVAEAGNVATYSWRRSNRTWTSCP